MKPAVKIVNQGSAVNAMLAIENAVFFAALLLDGISADFKTANLQNTTPKKKPTLNLI